MTEIAAVTGCLILGCLAVFQAALIAGAPIGRFAWGGKHDVLPLRLRIGSCVSIALYLFFAIVLLQKSQLITIGWDGVSGAGIWAITVYFFCGVVLNAASRSKPERLLMSPTALVLALAFLAIALQ